VLIKQFFFFLVSQLDNTCSLKKRACGDISAYDITLLLALSTLSKRNLQWVVLKACPTTKVIKR